MCETIRVGLYTMTQELKKALVQAMANMMLFRTHLQNSNEQNEAATF